MEIEFRDLGTIDYQSAWDLQEQLLRHNVEAKIRARSQGNPEPRLVPTVNHLLFCEHPHVYTLGKSGDIAHVLIGEEERKIRANPAAAGSAVLRKVFGALK